MLTITLIETKSRRIASQRWTCRIEQSRAASTEFQRVSSEQAETLRFTMTCAKKVRELDSTTRSTRLRKRTSKRKIQRNSFMRWQEGSHEAATRGTRESVRFEFGSDVVRANGGQPVQRLAATHKWSNTHVSKQHVSGLNVDKGIRATETAPEERVDRRARDALQTLQLHTHTTDQHNNTEPRGLVLTNSSTMGT